MLFEEAARREFLKACEETFKKALDGNLKTVVSNESAGPYGASCQAALHVQDIEGGARAWSPLVPMELPVRLHLEIFKTLGEEDGPGPRWFLWSFL